MFNILKIFLNIMYATYMSVKLPANLSSPHLRVNAAYDYSDILPDFHTVLLQLLFFSWPVISAHIPPIVKHWRSSLGRPSLLDFTTYQWHQTFSQSSSHPRPRLVHHASACYCCWSFVMNDNDHDKVYMTTE